MKFSKLKPREIKFLIATGVVAFVIFNVVVIWPQWKSVEGQKAKIHQLKDDIRVQNEVLSRVPAWTSEVAELSKQREVSSPNVTTQEAWMKHFESLAKNGNLELPRRSPLKPETPGKANILRVDCEFRGSLESVVKFMFALQDDSARPQIEVCQISPVKPGEDMLRGNMIVAVGLKPAH